MHLKKWQIKAAQAAIPWSVGCLTLLLAESVPAQLIPTPGGTQTQVIQQNNLYEIQGGLLSEQGDNLFHSFEQFNLMATEVANFQSAAQVENIIGQVVGGQSSFLDGLIQVSGSPANLYLINPAGILFGPNATLNLPAAFMATTATGLQFDEYWLNSLVANPYDLLNGTPTALAFTEGVSGNIINHGQLAVASEQSLSLLGNAVLNTGTLSAPSGSLTVAAIPGTQQIRLAQMGNVLNLEGDWSPSLSSPTALAAWLTGDGLDPAQAIVENPDGTLQLTGLDLTTALPAGSTILAGRLEVSGNPLPSNPVLGNQGGRVQILGEQIALVGAVIEAVGATAGGQVFIGGDYQGQGTLPRAVSTWVDSRSQITVDAINQGDGGRVILWADQITQFWGHISARGGQQGGNGGFIEVSSKSTLGFNGTVNLEGLAGAVGTLLLDPEDIIIKAGSGVGTNDIPQVFSAEPGAPFILFEETLEGFSGNTNIILQATNHITIEDLANPLTFQSGTGSITLIANADSDSVGEFRMEDTQDQIVTNGRNLTILGTGITVGDIDTSVTAFNNPNAGGSIILNASHQGISTGNLSSFSAALNNNSGNGGNITLAAVTDITVGAITSFATAGNNNAGSGGDISLQTSTGNVTTHDINTYSLALNNNATDGGTVAVTAETGSVTTGQINSSASALFNNQAGVGGDVFLTAQEDIQVRSINAESDLGGAVINIATDAFFRATSSFLASDFSLASLSTLGDGGLINIEFNHHDNTPFVVGNAAINGTAAAIIAGDDRIDPSQTLGDSTIVGNIQILNQGTSGSGNSGTSGSGNSGSGNSGSGNSGTSGSGTSGSGNSGNIDSPFLELPDHSINDLGESLPNLLSQGDDQMTTTSSSVNLTTQSREGTQSASETSSQSSDTSTSKHNLSVNDLAIADLEIVETFTQIETAAIQGFSDYLNLSNPPPAATLDDIREVLQTVAEQQDLNAAVIYVHFVDDQLELLLLTASGPLGRYPIPGATRPNVEKVVQTFQQTITNPVLRANQYLPPAQQLYQWLIAPLKPNLEQQQIESLAFILEPGLRSLPLAALHDGEHFLVESYSLGTLPSFGLTDFSQVAATSLEKLPILGMGIDQFTDQSALFAVPYELALITQEHGKAFLNEDVTLDNLQWQLRQQPTGILHLATHAVFKSGAAENSYLQLWDQKLNLRQFQQLPLGNIPLVVLSACTTALGDRGAEYGFAGLALSTGSQTAMASLWAVSDEGTLGFMAEFYRQLDHPVIRSEALRQAQLAMLTGQVGISAGQVFGPNGQPLAFLPQLAESGSWDFSHPAYWAAFSMVGNPW